MGTSRRRRLRAGPWRLIWEAGGLRWLELDGVEVVRGIQLTARDRSWSALEPSIHGLKLTVREDAFAIAFMARYRAGGFALDAEVAYVGDATGAIRATFHGRAIEATLAQRVGFIVLHPADSAGRPWVAETDLGTVRGTFPAEVVGERMASGAHSFRWLPVDSVNVALAFDGARWEMEDQRAWTDASFKSYHPPLAVPHPMTIPGGAAVRSEIALSVARLEPRSGPGGRRQRHRPAIATIARTESGTPLPAIGHSWASPMAPADLDQLRRHPPAHLRVVVDRLADDWRDSLRLAAADASRLGCGLQLEAIAFDEPMACDELASIVESIDVPVASVLAFGTRDDAGLVTTAGSGLATLRDAIRRVVPDVRSGAGSRADYALLLDNAVRVDGADDLAFHVCPQIHASDEASVLENTSTLPTLIDSARALGGRDLDLLLTFRPRFNAYADPPERAQSARRFDARLHAPFGACWLVASLAGLLSQGTRRLTVLEAAGPASALGGALEPIVGALQALRGGHYVPIDLPPGWAGFAVRDQGATQLFLANLRPRRAVIRVAPTAGSAPVSVHLEARAASVTSLSGS